MNSIETLNVATVPAFTIQYTGTGTGTLTHASHVITMARANVNAFTLTYTGGAATCTVAQDADTLTIARTAEPAIALTYIGTAATCTAAIAANTLTIARTAEDAFSLVYTGAEATATVAVAANTLTYQLGEAEAVNLDLTNVNYNTIAKVVAALDAVEGLTCTLATGAIDTNAGTTIDALETTSIKTAVNLNYTPANLTYDLTNGSYDTIAKVVTTLDALDLYTCTLISGAINTNASTTLNNKTATSIKTTLNLTYTPANLTWDLTNASYNTMGEIIAALDALTNYTCTIATGAVATDASALLDTLEAASIKTAKTLTYTYADVTLDCSNASYNTVTEVIEALDALNGVVTSAETTTFLTMDAIKINEFEATNIATALAVTIHTGEVTTAFLPLGEEIRVEGTEYLAIYGKVDINSTNNMRLKATARLESGGTDYVIDHSQIKYSRDAVATDKSYIEIANDEDQYLMWLIPIYGYSHIQLWISAETVGATAGEMDEMKYQNIKGVPL